MNPSGSPTRRRGDISSDGQRYWDGDVWQWQSFWLVADEVAEAAHQQFGRTAHTVSFLAAGMLNQSWRVDTHDDSYVLRVSRRERTRAQVAYEHEFLRQLKGYVDEVVAPLSGSDGETIQFWREHILSLFPFVDGVSGETVDAKDRLPQVASALARIHRASLDRVTLGQRPGFQSFEEEWRTIWRETHSVLRRDLDGNDDLERLLGTLEREVVACDRWLNDAYAMRRSLARATIHGDFNPRNLMFRKKRLATVVDWDECRRGAIAREVVWEVAQVGLGAPGVDPLGFWYAYLDAGGPLQHRDLKLMFNLARMSAFMELQWTVKEHRATPHAIEQLTGVVEALSRIGAIEIQL